MKPEIVIIGAGMAGAAAAFALVQAGTDGRRIVLFEGEAHPGYHSSGFGFTAYAAGERQLSDVLVLGLLVDINRTDFYHPTSVGIYLRHAFGTRPTSTTFRPLGSYNR